ncbi:MAG: T9SS type A sorting domain-containing protein, partial [Desulfobacterales bacterium]
NTHFIFYKEDTKIIRMDLSNMVGNQPAVAVDAKLPYHQFDLGALSAKNQAWRSPYKSDWAVAVGVFEHTDAYFAKLPKDFVLDQNYPNPFNPSTTIAFALPKPAHVRLSLFDILGREIAILVDEKLPAGQHKTVFNATGLAGGIYFFRMQAGEFESVKRMLFLK